MRLSLGMLLAAAVAMSSGTMSAAAKADEVRLSLNSRLLATHAEVDGHAEGGHAEGGHAEGVESAGGIGIPCVQVAKRPVWTFQSGVLVMRRDDPNRGTLFTTWPAVAADRTPLMDASDLRFGAEPGWQISGTRHFERYSAELRYFGIDSWTADHTVRTQQGYELQVASPPGVGVQAATPPATANLDARYGTDLHSGEVNLWRPLSQQVSIMSGFRMVQLSDQLNVVERETPDRTLHVDTNNYLYGGQAGLAASLIRADRLATDLIAKASVMRNWADNNTVVTTEVGDLFATDRRRGKTAFLGELELSTRYRMTDCLSFWTSYQLMFVDGVALAPDQVPNTRLSVTPELGTGVESTNTIFFHGAAVGLQLVR